MQINGQQIRVAPLEVGVATTQTVNVAGVEFKETYQIVSTRVLNAKSGDVLMCMGTLSSTDRPDLSRQLGTLKPIYTDVI